MYTKGKYFYWHLITLYAYVFLLIFRSNAWPYGHAIRLHTMNYKIITFFKKFDPRIFKIGYKWENSFWQSLRRKIKIVL
jgi:hypothetical protein